MTDPARPADGPPAKVTEEDKRDVLAALPGSIPVPKLDPKAKQAEQAHKLRGGYGWVLLAFLAAQLIAADIAFFMYAAWGVHWVIPPVVMSSWLGATVVEVIGVVYVITRSLFPLRDNAE